MEIMQELAMASWQTLCEMAPYLLLGFLVAGILSVLVSPELVEKHLGGHGFLPILKAALFGVPLPLCSCGVIPVAASLRRHGSSKAAVVSFLLSTPQTGVDSIMATYSLLGPVFAVFRPIVALFTGLIGGLVIEFFDRDEHTESAPPETCHDECCAPSQKHRRLGQALRYGFVVLPRDIAKPLLAGLLVAGAISAFVPDDFFAGVLGSGFMAMVVMMIVGIPMYVCATASVPIAAAMILKGVSPGAALVFLIAGPATNIAALATFWKILGKKTTLLYLSVVVGTALISGLFFDFLLKTSGLSTECAHGEMASTTTGPIFAVILLVTLAAALLPRRDHPHPAVPSGHLLQISIGGMTCSHCTESVKRALEECPGIVSAEVSLKHREAVISGRGYDLKTLQQAVESLGYTWQGTKEA